MTASDTSTPHAAREASKSPLRWLMLALVWLLYFCFGISVASIPPLVSPIVEDLGMTYVQMGLVLGAWQLVYIGTASPLGALVDRLGIRRSLGIGILVVWVSLVTRGLAVNFPTLFLAVALFGFGAPIISVGAPKLVSVWFRGRERGLAAGIYATAPLSGFTFSLATAGSLVIPLTGSWRGISIVYGAIVLVVAAAWWLLSRDHPSSGEEAVQRASSGAPSTWTVLRELLRIRNVRLMLVMAVGVFFLNHGLNNWVPSLLEEKGMSLTQAGIWAASATAAGGLGILIVPSVTRHGTRVVATVLLLAGAAGGTVGLGLLGGPALIGSLIATNFARDPLMPVLTLILMETPGVGARRMGAAAGLFFAAAEIGGFGGPFLLGLLRDATDSLTAGVFVLTGTCAVLVFVAPFVRERATDAPGSQVNRHKSSDR